MVASSWSPPLCVLTRSLFYGQALLWYPYLCVHTSSSYKDTSRSELGITLGLLQWLRGKESACSAEDAGHVGLIPGSGRSSGGGHGNPI